MTTPEETSRAVQDLFVGASEAARRQLRAMFPKPGYHTFAGFVTFEDEDGMVVGTHAVFHVGDEALEAVKNGPVTLEFTEGCN